MVVDDVARSAASAAAAWPPLANLQGFDGPTGVAAIAGSMRWRSSRIWSSLGVGRRRGDQAGVTDFSA